MPRVVPSQVVGVIDRLFDWAASETKDRPTILHAQVSPQLAAVLDLVERIPDELFVLNADDYATLRVCVVGLHEQIGRWRIGDPAFTRIPGLPKQSPIALIRQLLAKCPDQASAPGTVGLSFVTDSELRESIRLDISAAHRDLGQAEWKGATVLAGAAVEALFLWAIQQHEQHNAGSIAVAGAALVAAKVLGQQPQANPERWDLHEYVEIAAHLQLIEAETATQARQAKNFRNLIHPGRAARLGQKCDRGTALSALAAVELVVRDLTPP